MINNNDNNNDNNNRDDELDKVLALTKQTALNIHSMNEQFGILAQEMKGIKTTTRQNTVDIENLNTDFQNYKQAQKDRERIDGTERQEISNSITNRVSTILSYYNRFDLYKPFARKCWSDCKKYGYVVGDRGVDTKVMYYSDALNYIGNWEPVGHGGSIGYINYLDAKKEKQVI